MSGEYVPEWNIGICRPGGKGVHFGAGLKEKVAMWLVAFFHGEGNESVIASALEKANVGQTSAYDQEKAKVRQMFASGQEKAEVRSTPVTAKEKTGGGPSPGYIKENAARLLDVHGDSVLRMAYSYMHNMQDAEDILQEAYDFEE